MQRLGELRSMRSIRALLEAFEKNGRENRISVLPGDEKGMIYRLKGSFDWHQPEDQMQLFLASVDSLVKIALERKQNCHPLLIEALRSSSPVVRALACNLLVLSGASPEVSPALRNLLEDRDAAVDQAAAEALKAIEERRIGPAAPPGE